MKKAIDIKLTPAGFEKLKEEQMFLLEKRPGVVKRLTAAREQGDLSENAGYHAAKEELGYVDSRLRMLKLLIRSADVVEATSSDIVTFGCTVTVNSGDETRNFTIVSGLEADPAHGKMSDSSPIGSALIGKKVGDIVEISVPDGKAIYQLIKIAK
mgnify:CR=1 FL=1